MTYTHAYTVNLRWDAERKGTLYSDELDQNLSVATPPPFPKGMEKIWSPEHLFTAAVSSCLMTTFLAIAENSKLAFERFACKATGKLDQAEGKYRMTEVLLEPELVIIREEDYARAERILQKSEAACLITNSINSKVEMKPVIKVLKPV
ncbi:MAG: OsmC family protein [Flammeovirgaceae bacterium]|nr:MAG: OsmC family protein [Flammeovirgaceae bacterium]